MRVLLNKWLTIGWYQYLFGFKQQGTLTISEKIQKIICRCREHPGGPIWYNCGFEPDMRCKDCGDEL